MDSQQTQQIADCYLIGSIYFQNQLKDLKDKVELKIGAKISKMTTENEIRFVCHNFLKNKCQFQFRFQKIEQKYKQELFSSKQLYEQYCQKQRYELVQIIENHKQMCYFSHQELKFYEMKNYLVSCKADIISIIKNQFIQNNRQLTPSEILSLLAEKKDLKPQFIYKGFQNNQCFKRQIKKKFDNIIAEVKKAILPHFNKKKITKYIVQKGPTPYSAILRKVCDQKEEDQEYIIQSTKRHKNSKTGYRKEKKTYYSKINTNDNEIQWSQHSLSSFHDLEGQIKIQN